MRKTKLTIYFAIISLGFFSAVGFANNALAWTYTADFEQGTLGTEAQGPSGLSDAFSQTLFTDEKANSGTKSAKVNWVQGTDAWGISGGSVIFPSTISDGGELWARGYFYFKSPWSHTANPVYKLFRSAHVATASGANVGFIGLGVFSDGQIAAGNEVDPYQTLLGVYLDIDKWQSLEMYIKFSLTTPITRVWKNGVLIFENTLKRTLNNTTDYADFSYIFTYWNGNVPQNQVSYIDDFVYTTDQLLNVDAAGNFMIGPIGWGSIDTTPPSAPTGLAVN